MLKVISPRREGLLSQLELRENRLDASGRARGRLMRNLQRLFWLRGRFLFYLFNRLGIKLPRDRFLRAKMFWNKEITLPTSDNYAISLYCFGLLTGEDVFLAKFLLKNLQPESVFYDIGANYGYYGLLAREMAQDGEVHFFEPVPPLAQNLRDNTQGIKNVFVNQVAVGNLSGEAVLYESPDNNMSGISTIIKEVADFNIGQVSIIEVPIITLGEYVKDHRPPTILKIDVEGAEDLVVLGAGGALLNRPVVIMEVWYRPLDNSRHVRAVELLLDLGYRAYRINPQGDLVVANNLREQLKFNTKSGSGEANENIVFKY